MNDKFTDPQLQIAVAEKCGWKVMPTGNETFPWCLQNPKGDKYRGCSTVKIAWSHGLPDYPHDLNAMQQAILAQSEEFQCAFAMELLKTTDRKRLWSSENSCPLFHQLTARDWAECFVEVWKEMKK